MKETVSKSIIWNKAGISAIPMALVPILYSIVTRLLSGAGSAEAAFGSSLLSGVLWMVKLVLCIWMMAWAMRRLAAGYDGVTNRDTFHYGVAIALFSAILVSAWSLADMVLIHPEFWQEQLNDTIRQLSPMLDSNSQEALSRMEGSFPTISFFTTLIYCFLYGTVLSSILSRNIPRQDPFAGFRDGAGDNNDVDNQ